jgi:2-polyprenyl-6-methoxyphenol hydroxylase-like FAD-dependent oxidoreductase
VPSFAARVNVATRVERFAGGSVANFFRKPYGPGWVLIGDAGYSKDPITAQGISDAFRDAQAASDALGTVFRGEGDFDSVMEAFQKERDEAVLPMYGFTTELATLEPPPQMQQLLGAVAGNPDAMDAFVSVSAGTLSPALFFAPDNVVRVFTASVDGSH